MTFDTITLLSDFGTGSESVGALHSILRAGAPEAVVIDLTHDIAPFDLRSAAVALLRTAEDLAPGILVAMVNPGTGTDQRLIAVEVGDHESVVIGPDNGLLAGVVAMSGGATRAVTLQPEGRSSRHVFLAAAVRLAKGADLLEIGQAVDPGTFRAGVVAFAERKGTIIEADVLWIDRFGNVQLNVTAELLDGDETIRVESPAALSVRRITAFAALRGSEVGFFADRMETITLACNQASAAHRLGLKPADGVTLQVSDQP